MEKELLSTTITYLERGRKELSNIDLEITKKALPGLDEIIEHVSAPLMIMVMGEFSTGKSTFINAMVGKEVTAVNATPTTAVITKLSYGAEDKIRVHFIDGKEEEYEIDSFKELTAKTGITGEDTTHASIEYVERNMPLDILKYVTIIDSPGLNDINEQHSDTTKKFVHNSDTVFWMFSALQTGSQTEVTAMESLSPRLKPIAIVNKMDEIDEEEDDPEEFLENIRIQLKDKVQAVVGISAKYALEGKLEHNEDKTEIGHFKELEKVVRSLVLPNRDRFKMNSLMDELGEWVDSFASDIKETRDVNQRNQDADYDEYLDLKTKLQYSGEALAGIVAGIKKYVVDESKKYNEQAMYLLGVLYDQGVIFAEDDKLAEQYLEAAALKNHTLAQTSLGAMYYNKNAFKKSKFWLEKAVVQNNKLALTLLGLICLTDEKTGKLNIQRANADKAVPLLKKAASLGEDNAQYFLYNLFINEAWGENDSERAYGYLMQSAENGNENALVKLGKLFVASFEEDGNKEDIIKSIEYFSQAANKGNAEAIFNLGEIYRIYWANDDRIEKSFHWYKKAALRGNAEAQYWIAKYYETGSGIGKNAEQAFVWYQKSAEQDYIDAQISLAICYRDGLGVEKDINKTCYWLEKAGNLGNTDAQRWLANYYRDNKQLEKAFVWYMKTAEQGDAGAQNMIARCYEEGWGVAKDSFSAFDWYSKAAKQNDTSAAYNLAGCYQEGDGTAKDIAQALVWYEKAAEQGLSDAQLMVGRYYEEGWGTPKDAYRAFAWYKKAAEQGHAAAQNKVGECYYSGFGTSVNYKSAFYWWQKAAEQGIDAAVLSLAFFYQEGIGTAQDYTKALELYTKIANKGDAAVQNTVGEYYKNGLDNINNGEISEGQKEQAVFWFKKSAEQGNGNAQNNLAWCYQEGFGVPKNQKVAFAWYEKAAEQGICEAQHRVAECYAYGHGVEKDGNKAAYWLQKAADQGYAKALVDLASLYRVGSVFPKDMKKAFLLTKKAAEQGYDIAQAGVALYYSEGDGVEQDKREACRWAEKAIKQGNEFCISFYIGLCCELAESSNDEAVKNAYYAKLLYGTKILAEKGDTDAQWALGELYKNGLGTTRNIKQAVFWYNKSAEQGNAEALFALGECYEHGDGVTQDLKKSYYLYNESAKAGHEGAKQKIDPSVNITDKNHWFYYIMVAIILIAFYNNPAMGLVLFGISAVAITIYGNYKKLKTVDKWSEISGDGFKKDINELKSIFSKQGLGLLMVIMICLLPLILFVIWALSTFKN